MLKLDDDFQKTYQAAERAYGEKDFLKASQLAAELLQQLNHNDQNANKDAVLGWRSVICLLMGHIELHGLHQLDQASHYYQLCLDSKPEQTITELAKQGLEQIQALSTEHAPSDQIKPLVTQTASILQDPFLKTPSTPSSMEQNQVTAMPWLGEIRTAPATQTKSTSVEDTTDTSNSDIQIQDQEIGQRKVSIEQTSSAEPEILKDIEPVAITPIIQSTPEVLDPESFQRAWLRITIKPEIMEETEHDKNQTKSASFLVMLKRAIKRK